MDILTGFIPAKSRVHRKRNIVRPAGADLVLVQATFSPSPKVLWLYFDREIDVGAVDGSQIVVDDGQYNSMRFDASGGVVSHGPMLVILQLVEIGASTGDAVKLTASGSSGIVAADDGGTWPGVEDLGLPFP